MMPAIPSCYIGPKIFFIVTTSLMPDRDGTANSISILCFAAGDWSRADLVGGGYPQGKVTNAPVYKLVVIDSRIAGQSAAQAYAGIHITIDYDVNLNLRGDFDGGAVNVDLTPALLATIAKAQKTIAVMSPQMPSGFIVPVEKTSAAINTLAAVCH